MEGSVFSNNLIDYVNQHSPPPSKDTPDRFRLFITAWLPATILKDIQGNPLSQHKLDDVRSWLTSLDKFHQDGLPMISIGCYTGSVRLVEGNHRAYVLMEDFKVEKRNGNTLTTI